MFNLKPLTFETVLSMLENMEQAFTLSRHKDGEFYAIMGTDRSHNCDKHTYFHDMGEALLWTLIDNQDKHENRMYGMQPMVHRKMYEPVDKLDTLSARPDFAVLIYPAYLDEGKDKSISPELKLDKNTPPIFIFVV